MGIQVRSDPAGCAATKLSRSRGRLAIGAAARGRRETRAADAVDAAALGRPSRRDERARHRHARDELDGLDEEHHRRGGPRLLHGRRRRAHGLAYQFAEEPLFDDLLKPEDRRLVRRLRAAGRLPHVFHDARARRQRVRHRRLLSELGAKRVGGFERGRLLA